MSHPLLSTTKVVRTIQEAGAAFEVCAEAVARHEKEGGNLTVQLSAFLRAEGQEHIGEKSRPSWLPAPETVTEHVAHDEAHAVTSEIFANWCKRVTEAVPG